MSNFRGGPFDIYGGETVATSGKVHDRLLAVLAIPCGTAKRYRPPLERR